MEVVVEAAKESHRLRACVDNHHATTGPDEHGVIIKSMDRQERMGVDGRGNRWIRVVVFVDPVLPEVDGGERAIAPYPHPTVTHRLEETDKPVATVDRLVIDPDESSRMGIVSGAPPIETTKEEIPVVILAKRENHSPGSTRRTTGVVRKATRVVGVEPEEAMFRADPDKPEAVLMEGVDIVDVTLLGRTMTGEPGIGATDREGNDATTPGGNSWELRHGERI